jgi:hypothetical protein
MWNWVSRMNAFIYDALISQFISNSLISTAFEKPCFVSIRKTPCSSAIERLAFILVLFSCLPICDGFRKLTHSNFGFSLYGMNSNNPSSVTKPTCSVNNALQQISSISGFFSCLSTLYNRSTPGIHPKRGGTKFP